MQHTATHWQARVLGVCMHVTMNTATHYNTLQHMGVLMYVFMNTAAHCNTLEHMVCPSLEGLHVCVHIAVLDVFM